MDLSTAFIEHGYLEMVTFSAGGSALATTEGGTRKSATTCLGAFSELLWCRWRPPGAERGLN